MIATQTFVSNGSAASGQKLRVLMAEAEPPRISRLLRSLFPGVSPPARGAVGQELSGTELILIAEDHESIREMARHSLLRLGYRVLSAGDGEEALRLAAEERPALAVLDVIMPKLGGAATAAQLVERFPELPIIFTSGYTQEATGLPATMRLMSYLQKPYSPTALGKLVRNVLDQHAQS